MKQSIGLMTLAILFVGTSIPAVAMEKAEADERTNPLMMEKAEADERTNPLMMEKAEADERTNPLMMEKAEADEHANPLMMEKAEADERTNPLKMEKAEADERTSSLRRASTSTAPGEVTLRPGQRLPVQNGGVLTLQGRQVLLVKQDGSRQLFPYGSQIVKQPNGLVAIWGTNGTAIWGVDGAGRGLQ